MKTRLIASMTGGLLRFLLAALILLSTTACKEDPPIFHEDLTKPEARYSGNIMSQSFWVNPEGGDVTLFDGALEIIIPEGAVPNSTEFTMATFPVHHLDLGEGKMYIRGFSLVGGSSQQMFTRGITMKVKYDMEEENWLKGLPANEENLQIYWVSPLLYSFERVVPFESCCVDCDCKIIKGCTVKCGFYVIGEK